MKKLFFLLLTAALAVTVIGCSQKKAETYPDEDHQPYTPSVYDRPTIGTERPGLPSESPFDSMDGESADGPLKDLTGYTISRLTGLPIPEEDALRRPVAVVINNLFPAHPQSGLSQADIIYEVLAEGNITRLVAIFQSFDAPKIGPVRSARDYFVDFALDYDAIFVHHGGSPSGYARLNSMKINRLDGITLENMYFWRDRTYPEWDTAHAGATRPMEHSSYTSGTDIKDATAALDFRDTLAEHIYFGYLFENSTSSGGDFSAHQVTVPFSKDYTRTFTYDPQTELYAVYNRNGPHLDANDQEALYVTNILIQSARVRIVPGDAEGRREVGAVGTGDGYLITGGTYRRVHWEKPDHTTPTMWFFEDGMPMYLHTGKTWICVFQDNEEAVFE